MTPTTGDHDLPLIISVDDHVVEPPDLWTARLPSRYHCDGPRVERDRVRYAGTQNARGELAFERGGEDGDWCDWWVYGDLEMPLHQFSVAATFSALENRFLTFDEVDDSCLKPSARLAAMDRNHVEVSVCFPNTLPRFCGQTFLRGADRQLSLLCVQAYNDWMIDEWCGAEAAGRLVPLTLVPLWDVELAAAEVRRCAAKGSAAIAFSENPSALGLPSVHDRDRYWDVLFAACEETGTVINLHIGSSSSLPRTSADAPYVITSTLIFQNTMGAMLDYVLSGTFDRFPNLRLALAEGQVGWMPYVLDRADKLWHERFALPDLGFDLDHPPSTYLRDHIWGCIFDDPTGLELRDRVGMSQIMFEVDFPHADSTYPNTRERVARICRDAHLSDSETYDLLRGNAIRAFDLSRFGIDR